ncbi:3716_t:CDS:2, partial [Funneliformis geosporum]
MVWESLLVATSTIQLLTRILKALGIRKDGITPGSFMESIEDRCGGRIFSWVEFLCVRFVRYFDLDNIILSLLKKAPIIVKLLKNGMKRLYSFIRNWWALVLISTLAIVVQRESKKDKTRRLKRGPDNERFNAHLKSYYYFDYVKRLKDDNTDIFPRDTPTENPKICIIGAGLAGLFSALLLKEAGIKDITILEYQDRVGGRVHTHYFTDDPDDERRLYGEIGAMRLPYVEGRPELSPHQLVFDTIDYLNEYNKDDDKKQITTIPFIFSDSNAIYYFNNKKDHTGKLMTKNYSATVEVSQLGYPDTMPSNFLDLWNEALQPFFDVLNTDFTKGLKMLKRYDQHSIYSYLKEVFLPARLPKQAEDYDEIISEFLLSFVDMAIASYTFDNLKYPLSWNTIDKGMQRFPNAFLSLIKKEKMDLRYNSE